MTRIVLCCLPVLFFYCHVCADDNSRITQIRQSDDYYWGLGISENTAEARDRALSELTSQIAVRVSSDFEQKIIEHNLDFSSSVESVIKTHSTATLRNVESIIQTTHNGRVRVFCYLHKGEVKDIFDERKQLIAEMVNKADQYLDERNISSSLKLYYFAAVLLNSLPDHSVIYDGINYTTAIPTRINEILSKIDVWVVADTLLSEKEREITISVAFDNAPIGSLDITFWDGSNQVSVQARDGYATFHLFGSSVGFDEVHAKVKYAYYESRREYNVIEELWSLVNRPEFTNELIVSLERDNSRRLRPLRSTQTVILQDYGLAVEHDRNDVPVARITTATKSFLSALEDTSGNITTHTFATDQFLLEKIRRYKELNRPSPRIDDIAPMIQRTQSGWELRRIRVLHRYPSINKESTEYLVLDFTKDGTLIDFNTCITEELYQKFVLSPDVASDWHNRHEIVKFLEKYRTAYLTRDTHIIELMFADSALIIVGRVLKATQLPSDMVRYERLGAQPHVEYLRLSKSAYLRRLKSIFASQSDIFLDFPSFNIVRKNNAENIYGIEMRQSYTSTSYADEGYLFLLIDFNTADPLIYVRSWQPNAWHKDELITTASWRIYR